VRIVSTEYVLPVDVGVEADLPPHDFIKSFCTFARFSLGNLKKSVSNSSDARRKAESLALTKG